MNCAALIDLGAAKVSAIALEEAERQLQARFDYVKFYGYNAKKNGDLNPYIKANNAEVALPLHNRKKTRVDIRQVIDAVTVAYTNPSVEGIFVVCAEVDCQPMLAAIRKAGKKVFIGGESESSYAEKCDGSVVLAKTLPQTTRGDVVRAAADVREELPHSETPAPKEEEEFLPYTGIEPLDDERMRAVGEKLREAVEEKKMRKRAAALTDEKDELKRLLSKYF